MIVYIIAAAAFFLGAAWFFYEVLIAPVAYEDEDGWHWEDRP